MKETINYENGVYVGEIKGGEPHGQGTLTLHERFKYVGEFRAGKFHGRGTKTSVNGEVFDGYWKNGLQDGEGFHEGELGSYYGQFQNDCFHGHGVMTYPDGSKITGEFKEGKLDGFAIWEGEDIKVEDKVASGKLAGHYQKGELVGEGIQTNPDGTQTWVVFRGDDIYKEPVESIREGIQAYKQILEILNSTEKGSGHFEIDPLINFQNKETYPIEYQIFMEEIGPISIGYDYLFLNVTSPLNNNEFKTWLKYDGFAWWEDDEDLDDNLVFIGHECDHMPIFFKTDKVPYTLENDIHEDSFFIDLIDITLCEYIVPAHGIHYLELSEAKLEEIYRLADKFQSTKERINKIRSMPIVKDGYVEGGQIIKASQLSKESLEHLDNLVKNKTDEEGLSKKDLRNAQIEKNNEKKITVSKKIFEWVSNKGWITSEDNGSPVEINNSFELPEYLSKTNFKIATDDCLGMEIIDTRLKLLRLVVLLLNSAYDLDLKPEKYTGFLIPNFASLPNIDFGIYLFKGNHEVDYFNSLDAEEDSAITTHEVVSLDPLLISFFQNHGEYGFIKNKIEDKENQELKNNYEEIKVFSSWSVYLGDNKDKSWNDGPPFIRNVTDRNE